MRESLDIIIQLLKELDLDLIAYRIFQDGILIRQVFVSYGTVFSFFLVPRKTTPRSSSPKHNVAS